MTMSLKELTVLFNDKFGMDKTLSAIKNLILSYGIQSGRTGRFRKGYIPANIKPLGHERVDKYGFILIKVAEKNPHTGAFTRYKLKQVNVWEKAYGPVSEGMVVAFKDCDKTNFEPENLMLISQAELLNLNKRSYKDMPIDLKPSVLLLAKLQVKAFATGKSL
jgi:hypothetical protein